MAKDDKYEQDDSLSTSDKYKHRRQPVSIGKQAEGYGDVLATQADNHKTQADNLSALGNNNNYGYNDSLLSKDNNPKAYDDRQSLQEDSMHK